MSNLTREDLPTLMPYDNSRAVGAVSLARRAATLEIVVFYKDGGIAILRRVYRHDDLVEGMRSQAKSFAEKHGVRYKEKI